LFGLGGERESDEESHLDVKNHLDAELERRAEEEARSVVHAVHAFWSHG